MRESNTLPSAVLGTFSDRLRELRDRLIQQLESGVESIRQELNPAGNLSNVPVHLGDAAPTQLDADISVVDSERNILDLVQRAIHRIEQGTFGRCARCGKPILVERLQQIPYTPYCVRCQEAVEKERARSTGRDIGLVRLVGFEAIEFAEKEGLPLNKSGDAIDEAVEGLNIAEAEAIATDRPELIWIEVAREDYAARRNMNPGR